MTMIEQMPDEALWEILMRLDAPSLSITSMTCWRLHDICMEKVWPAKTAKYMGVRRLRGFPSGGWINFYRHVTGASGRDGGACLLHVQHEIGDTDTLQGLSLRYSVDTDLISRFNAIMSDFHLRHRSQVYIPLMTPEEREWCLEQDAEIIRDKHVNREYVVVRRVERDRKKALEDKEIRRQRICDLMVRLMSRGMNVDESEARYYLDDAQMDVSLACRNLIEDRKWG